MRESLLTQIPDNTNFLQLTKFTLFFPDLPFARYFCQSVVFPGVSTNAVMVPTKMTNTYRHGDTLAYDNLTITALVDEDFRVYEETYNWLRNLTTPIRYADYPTNKVNDGPLYNDAILTVYTNSNIANFRVKFRDCHPISLGGIQFNYSDTADNIPVVEITFRYDVFEIQRLDN